MESEDKSIKNIIKRQETCKHLAGFIPVAQQVFPDQLSKKLILINTIMCTTCGKQFMQSIMTAISIGKIQMPNFTA